MTFPTPHSLRPTPNAPPAGKLVWRKTARRDETLVAHRRIWYSRCGRYRVVECRPKVSLPVCFYAEELRDTDPSVVAWDVISRHRKRGPAFEACQRREADRTTETRRTRR